MKTLLSTLLILSFYFTGHSQTTVRQIEAQLTVSDVQILNPLPKQEIWANSFGVYDLNFEALDSELQGSDIPHRNTSNPETAVILSIPNPKGNYDLYKVFVNTTMHPDLRAYYPEIRTYDVVGLTNRNLFGKIDITPHGFHAMIFDRVNGTFFIDPVQQDNNSLYMAYYKSDFVTTKSMACSHESEGQFISDILLEDVLDIPMSYASCELRTYRLALAATAEYTIFHGGTVALALAAQVTTMNRVNGVYERELAITMEIIPNNDLIIYTNPATDPYTNGNASAMLGENISTCNSVIGNANYDIGHVFGTNSGGVAYLGVVCNNTWKGGGVTGSGAPIGDPFDVDYVAHEIGHQFGANHTQNNNCNRNNPTAMEPGSASTIMGYAGICAPDVQSNSDDHFHGVSLLEMGGFITGSGGTCAVITNIPNDAPTITSTNGGFTVPISTPFALTAVASDSDVGDILWYRWEQMNNNVTTQPPVSTATGGPNFRSFSSTTNPTRYFPRLEAIVSNGPFTWEVLPSVARTMNFRCTVHDDHVVGGCSDYENTTVTFDATAGPFVLTYPSATGITWAATTFETVTWNVANTTNTNVNCQFVNIYLSIDGGFNYPILLASNVPNNGSALVTVPNLPNTTSRVMVMAENGTFFDISDNNFTITAAPEGYQLVPNNPTVSVCSGTNAVFNFDIIQLGSYNDPVNLTFSGLPIGATAAWSVNPVIPFGSSSLTINTASIAAGSYTITINSNSTFGPQSVDVTLQVSAGTLQAVSLVNPANGATGLNLPINVSWNPSATPNVTYQVEIATDNGFSNIVESQSGLNATNYTALNLNVATTYYWRVRVQNPCGFSGYSSVSFFTTSTCIVLNSTNVPINIPASGTPTITSTLNVTQQGTINNLDVLNLIGTHTWVSDLTVSLTSPEGTSVVLFSGICGSQDNFNLNFSSNAAPGAIPCPPTTGLFYQPTGNLLLFNGEEMQGVWTLTVADGFNLDGGSLNSWGLGICFTPPICPSPSIAPSSINVVGTPYCLGGSLDLTQVGGFLAPGANYEWFSTSCGGTALGSGNSINVAPTVSTTYFVRASAGLDCPETACTSILIEAPNTSNDLSIDQDFATCLVNSGNWTHFYNAAGRLIASVNSNGQNLGNVTATSYVNGAPYIVPSCSDASDPEFFNAALARSFVITPQFQPINPVAVRLYIMDSEFAAYQSAALSTADNLFDDVDFLSELDLTKHSGTSQDGDPTNNCAGGTTLYIPQSASGATNTLIAGVNNSSYLEYVISGFSEFFPMSSNNSALPVTLNNFIAECRENQIAVMWSTSSEHNAAHFRLETSRDGYTWLLLDEIPAVGSSNALQHYEYLDFKFVNTTIYYRLIQVDNDGTAYDYGPISVNCESHLNQMYVFPNPTREAFQLSIDIAHDFGWQNLIVTDLSGKLVHTQNINLNSGTQLIPFENLNWSQGVYLLYIDGLLHQFAPIRMVIQ
jgi:subtilisin-like proprotein convertase family protein